MVWGLRFGLKDLGLKGLDTKSPSAQVVAQGGRTCSARKALYCQGVTGHRELQNILSSAVGL